MPEEEEQQSTEEAEEEKVEEEREDAEELLKKLKYLQAEFENYKKRVEKEMSNFVRFSSQSVISTLLPIMDDLEKACETMRNEEDASGIRMICNNLMKTLGNEGLEDYGAVGDDFDPFKHEAVAQIENKDMESNKIAEVVQKGYRFKDKILRPSKVVVVKNQKKEEQEEEDNGEDNRD